jgi:hypothetical protein
VDPFDLTAHRRDRERVEQLVGGVGLVAAVQLVEAQVVAPALEDGERGRAAQERFEGLRQAGEVAVDQLALQRDRGRGDDDRGALRRRVVDGGHQVGE